MTHLPFIVGAYAIAIVGACVLSLQAVLRLRRARRRLETRA